MKKNISTEVAVIVNDSLDRVRQSRLERVPDIWDDDFDDYTSGYQDDPEYREAVNRISEVTLFDQLRHRGW